MPTQCRRDLFAYEVVEGRRVVAAFDGGQITSDAGALLLGATARRSGRWTGSAPASTTGVPDPGRARCPSQLGATRKKAAPEI
jgi:hypothetical protein